MMKFKSRRGDGNSGGNSFEAAGQQKQQQQQQQQKQPQETWSKQHNGASPTSVAANPFDSNGRGSFNDEQYYPTNPQSSNNSNNNNSSQRASLVQRAMQNRPPSLTIVGTSYETPRSKSTGRSRTPVELTRDGSNDASEHSDKKLVSKAEKIKKLQAKNELYKEEYKRVQKDRKQLKKELETKKLEVAALTNEIDSHVAETSVLKAKLAEALQQIDQSDEYSSRHKYSMKKYNVEIAEKQAELDEAWKRIAEVRQDLDDLQEQVKRKDEQIESLTMEVSNQENEIQSLRQENMMLRKEQRKTEDQKIDKLNDENENLKNELGSTLERAAAMVKEREDAIADLLKENDEMKRLLSIRNKPTNNFSEEDWDRLKEDLDQTNASLEEAQDRIVYLEEEMETMVNRTHEMEEEIERLRDELDEWQRRAETAEKSVGTTQKSLQEREKQLSQAREALAHAEARHKSHVAELEIKHRTAILDAQERARQRSKDEDSISSAEQKQSAASQSAQAMLLEQAVANQRNKTVADSKSSWFSSFAKAADEDLTEEQKRIKDLEAIKVEQTGEIQKLKSEMVRLRSSYNEMVYVNKKKIERLSNENEAYELKLLAMERNLAEAKGMNPDEDVNLSV